MSVFADDAFDDHERVVFCSDKNTGLQAIIAMHSTVLGPAAGGCRLWSYATAEEALHDVLETLAEQSEVGMGQFIHPTRLALTGKTVGPGLFELAELLGREECVPTARRFLHRHRPPACLPPHRMGREVALWSFGSSSGAKRSAVPRRSSRPRAR